MHDRTTNHIANGGESSTFKHCSRHRAFVSVDNDALRKPPLAILTTVVCHVGRPNCL